MADFEPEDLPPEFRSPTSSSYRQTTDPERPNRGLGIRPYQANCSASHRKDSKWALHCRLYRRCLQSHRCRRFRMSRHYHRFHQFHWYHRSRWCPQYRNYLQYPRFRKLPVQNQQLAEAPRRSCWAALHQVQPPVRWDRCPAEAQVAEPQRRYKTMAVAVDNFAEGHNLPEHSRYCSRLHRGRVDHSYSYWGQNYCLLCRRFRQSHRFQPIRQCLHYHRCLHVRRRIRRNWTLGRWP